MLSANNDKEWLLSKAEQEDGCMVSVGGLVGALEGTNQVPAHKVNWPLVAEQMDTLTSQIVASKDSADRLKLEIVNRGHHASSRALDGGHFSVMKGTRKW